MAAKKKSSGKRKRDPMPEDALRDLERRLESGLPPIVILRGDERYFRDRGVAQCVAAAKAQGLEVCRHDALDPDYSAAALIDDLSTGALFQSARCVVVHSAERIVTERASAFSAAARDAMKARLSAGAEGAIVLSATKLLASHALAKASASADGLIVGCRRLFDSPPPWDPDPRKAELVQWCAQRARNLKIPLDLNEAAYIVAATGNDLAGIDDQLGRLVGRGKEGIQELVAWDASASPYEVADHLVAGDLNRSLAGLETLFSGGASMRDGTRTIDQGGIMVQLCGAVSAKLRESARAADFMRQGLDPKRAAAASGYGGPPRQVEQFVTRLTTRSPEEWIAMLAAFGDLERKTRQTVTVDTTDFSHFALRWRKRKRSGRSKMAR